MGRRSERFSARSHCSTDMLLPETDHTNLKAKNIELAKTLADTRVTYAHVVSQKDHLQREYFNECAKNNVLTNHLKTIDIKSRSTLKTLFQITDDISQIIQATSSALNYIESIRGNSFRSSTDASFRATRSPNKTQAVKPMVDGHVILRPTVKLTRVNQLFHPRQNTSSSNNVQTEPQSLSPVMNPENAPTNIETNDTSANLNTSEATIPTEDEVEDENLENDSATQSYLENTVGNILNTLRESEEDIASTMDATMIPLSGPVSITGAQNPILSGIFKEVRVYLSPLRHELLPMQRVRQRQQSSEFRNVSESNNSNEMYINMDTSNMNDLVNTSRPSTSGLTNGVSIQQTTRTETKCKALTSELQNSNASDATNNGNVSLPVDNNNTLNSSNYDPLEGPSTLLNDSEKIDTLKKLGLEPVDLINNTSTPVKNVNGFPKQSPSFVTKRRKEPSRELKFLRSSIVRKFSSPRISKSPNGSSDEDNSEARKCSNESHKPKTKQSVLCKRESLRPSKETEYLTASTSDIRQSPRQLDEVKKKIKRSCSKKFTKEYTESVQIKAERSNPELSSQANRTSGSPRRRPKRNTNTVSLAEPSLRKKLRR